MFLGEVASREAIPNPGQPRPPAEAPHPAARRQPRPLRLRLQVDRRGRDRGARAARRRLLRRAPRVRRRSSASRGGRSEGEQHAGRRTPPAVERPLPELVGARRARPRARSRRSRRTRSARSTTASSRRRLRERKLRPAGARRARPRPARASGPSGRSGPIADAAGALRSAKTARARGADGEGGRRPTSASRPPTGARRSCARSTSTAPIRRTGSAGSAGWASTAAGSGSSSRGDPRESNTEGGIFPAIFGTVMMVFMMSIVVVPFGVLAALYLREYAKQGPLVRTVRIAVNNLAGVPSIVFGVFGLGFFVYFVGGGDRPALLPRGAARRRPSAPAASCGPSLTLALLTVPVVIVAAEEALAAVPRAMREASLALGATKLQTILRVVLPARGARHPDRPDPGDGARCGRGGAADARRRRQARARAAARRLLPVPPPGPQVHAPRLPHLRRRLPEPQRRSGQADGLRHDDLPARSSSSC